MGAITSTLLATSALASGGLTAYGQYKQGKDTQKMYDYNAKVAEEEAGVIRQGSILRSAQARKRMKSVIGSQAAGYASSGVELTGSPLDVMKDSISNAELDIAVDEYNSDIQAKQRESEARMYRYYGREARREGTTNAMLTLLQEGSKAGMTLSTKLGGTSRFGNYSKDAIKGMVGGFYVPARGY